MPRGSLRIHGTQERLSKSTRRRLQRRFASLSLLLLLVAIVVVAVLDRARHGAVSRDGAGRCRPRVNAQPIELYAASSCPRAPSREELERLGYLAVATPIGRALPPARRQGQRVRARVRFAYERQDARALRLGSPAKRSRLETPQGREVAVMRLDPLLIGSIFPIHGEDRIVVAPDQVAAAAAARSSSRRPQSSTRITA